MSARKRKPLPGPHWVVQYLSQGGWPHKQFAWSRSAANDIAFEFDGMVTYLGPVDRDDWRPVE